ncbi:hypothetical protein [Bradyrhizobium oligotrophicum]|uniref:hypothetical protein n=1 Tax=Bradyrhizobium oligotrophicum TaxID=44255 RepID=UPI0005AB7A01|nr:hypothetical protein [Bradyrhizobium oligotrophicum]
MSAIRPWGKAAQTKKVCVVLQRDEHFRQHSLKNFTFAFSEIMICLRHPASPKRGVARDRHDTRGGEAMAADCRSMLIWRADER